MRSPYLLATRLFKQASLRQTCWRRQCRSFSSRDVLEDLSERGMIAQLTNNIKIHLDGETKRTVYMGVDPTANAFHVGHLLPLMCLLHFYLRGHKAIAVVGGATGLVGDPSGKLEERTPLGKDYIQANIENLSNSASRFIETATSYARARVDLTSVETDSLQVLNNLQWLGELKLLDFLTQAGRHARVPTMIARDSVKIRMTSEQGISFTEFTYQLLQAYDFFQLYQKYNCTIQIGGSDQWGNILAGIDLISRKHPSGDVSKAHGITMPLLTTSDGRKFGKSEGNAVWLDKTQTSVLDFYQFFLRTADADVGNYLKMFTLLPLHKITSVLELHMEAPEKRYAQETLARELVELVHGKQAVLEAQLATRLLWHSDFRELKITNIFDTLGKDHPLLTYSSRTDVLDQPVWAAVAASGLTPSKKEARRLASAGAIYLNGTAASIDRKLLFSDLIDNAFVVLRTGKHNHRVLVLN